MQILSEKDIIQKISKLECFSARLSDHSLVISIQAYAPYICTAIHAGHRIRENLQNLSRFDEAERLIDEAPYTDQIVAGYPITLVATNSCYEYDLNLPPSQAVYNTARGQAVWKKPLPQSEIEISLAKHQRYYTILTALCHAVEQRHGGCLMFDIRSFNYKVREQPEAPVFNLGTAYIKRKKWHGLISALRESLSLIKLPNQDVSVQENVVSQGQGYQAEYVSKHFNNTLLIPLSIKKIFMDELSGTPYPLVLDQLDRQLRRVILDTAARFVQKLGNGRPRRAEMAGTVLEPLVCKVDRQLFNLGKGVDTLLYVNPVNLLQEKRKFLTRHGRYEPAFRYRQLQLDPYLFREQLYRLPVSDIQDAQLRYLYRQIIDSYATKVDLLTTIGSEKFLYNSLRYYGKPNSPDIDNAKFLLHAAPLPSQSSEPEEVNAEAAVAYFQSLIDTYQLKAQAKISNRLVAKALVDNSKRQLLVNRSLSISARELKALGHHEVGIHLVTTSNALEQPLKLLRLGLPMNTHTQEGLAILSEYLSGNLSITRLHALALRVIAVNEMSEGARFSEVYQLLREQYRQSEDDAFTLCSRVFRGGGFTKDYLYLRGLVDLYKAYQEKDISILLTGKTALSHLDTLKELVQRHILKAPPLIPTALQEPLEDNVVMQYLLSSLQ